MAPPEDGQTKSFYDVLGIQKNSSDSDIRSAYKSLAKKWHPDKWAGEPSSVEEAKSKFQQIQEAYSVLSDGYKRAMYDAGVYEPEDDVDGFSDFLDEMATMMATVRDQNTKGGSLSDLQQAFDKMVNENWFSTEEAEDFNDVQIADFDVVQKAEFNVVQGVENNQKSLLTRMDSFFHEEYQNEDDAWGFSDPEDITYIAISNKFDFLKRGPDEMVANDNQKKAKVSSKSGKDSMYSLGSSIPSMGSVTPTTSVARHFSEQVYWS